MIGEIFIGEDESRFFREDIEILDIRSRIYTKLFMTSMIGEVNLISRLRKDLYIVSELLT